MLRRDQEATMAQHFLCPDSYVTPYDGRHILKGEDWKSQKYMVWCRGGGQCEKWYGNERCTAKMVHCHHIIKRSDGRDDRLANLIGLCSVCHRLEHPEKQTRWTKRSAA